MRVNPLFDIQEADRLHGLAYQWGGQIGEESWNRQHQFADFLQWAALGEAFVVAQDRFDDVGGGNSGDSILNS